MCTVAVGGNPPTSSRQGSVQWHCQAEIQSYNVCALKCPLDGHVKWISKKLSLIVLYCNDFYSPGSHIETYFN